MTPHIPSLAAYFASHLTLSRALQLSVTLPVVLAVFVPAIVVGGVVVGWQWGMRRTREIGRLRALVARDGRS